jgi:putative endonuclease
LERRVREHQPAQVEGFTKRYRVHRLVYFETFRTPRAAIAREKEIKGWIRAKKLALIESLNPTWEDLSAKWDDTDYRPSS